MHYTHIEK